MGFLSDLFGDVFGFEKRRIEKMRKEMDESDERMRLMNEQRKARRDAALAEAAKQPTYRKEVKDAPKVISTPKTAKAAKSEVKTSTPSSSRSSHQSDDSTDMAVRTAILASSYDSSPSYDDSSSRSSCSSSSYSSHSSSYDSSSSCSSSSYDSSSSSSSSDYSSY